MTREARVFRPDQRPDVEVLVDGTWYRGELRSWVPDPADAEHWLANVQYRLELGATHVDTFAEELVRPDERTER